jgi:hypothetical protein
MGMTCIIRRAEPDRVAELMDNPARVGTFLYGEPSGVRRYQPGGLLGLLLRVLPIRVEEVDPDAPMTSPDPDVLSLEKNWHGLHFLFTGTAWEGEFPGAFLLTGGTELEDDEFDHPPRVLDPHLTGEVDAFLTALSPSDLTLRFDAERMTNLRIYPDAVWLREGPGESPLQDLLDTFTELREFVHDAHRRGHTLIVHVS